MPFDINVILAAFQVPFTNEWKRITDTLEELGKKIREQAERSSLLERASRDFIEWPFQDDALVLQITASQRFSFHPQSQPLLPASIRQEWLLPGLMARFHQVTGAIRDAVARFQAPRSSMFNPAGARFTDIFGHAALLVRALVHDYGPVRQLEDTAFRAGFLYLLYTQDSRASGTAAASSASSVSFDSLPGMIAGMLLLVPAFLDWLYVLVREANLFARIRTLDELESVQAMVYSIKTAVLSRFFEKLRSSFQSVMEFAFAVEYIFLRSVAYYGVFLTIYLRHLALNLAHFSDLVSLIVSIAVLGLSMISRLVEAMRSIDIIEGINLGDLLDTISAGAINGWLVNRLDDLERASRIAGDNIHDGVIVIRALLRAALHPRYHNIRPVVPNMPDPYAVAVEPHLGQLLGVLHQLRDAVSPEVAGMLRTGSDTMLAIADAADGSARQAANAGSAAIWQALSASSTALAQRAFPAQTARADPLATAYEQTLAGGLGNLQALIPRYVGGVIEWWHTRQAELHGQTSPHILARRARLTRVRIPRLNMEVHGFDMTSGDRREELLERLQEKMREQVERAWGRGELRVAEG